MPPAILATHHLAGFTGVVSFVGKKGDPALFGVQAIMPHCIRPESPRGSDGARISSWLFALHSNRRKSIGDAGLHKLPQAGSTAPAGSAARQFRDKSSTDGRPATEIVTDTLILRLVAPRMRMDCLRHQARTPEQIPAGRRSLFCHTQHTAFHAHHSAPSILLVPL